MGVGEACHVRDGGTHRRDEGRNLLGSLGVSELQDRHVHAVLRHEPDVRSDLLQQVLDLDRQPNNVIWRTRPEYEAVPRVLEAWFDLGTFQPQQERVNDQLLVFAGKELFLLLLVSLGSVGRVKRLDFGLRAISGSEFLSRSIHGRREEGMGIYLHDHPHKP